jgi:CHASE3 domain sensor protein
VAGVNQTLKELRDMTAGDLERQESLSMLDPITRKLSELKQTASRVPLARVVRGGVANKEEMFVRNDLRPAGV